MGTLKKFKVLVIDPASVSSGWAIADQDYTIVAHGTVLAPDAPIATRLWVIQEAFSEILVKNKPNAVILEQVSKNTHHYVNMAVGVIMAECARRNIPVEPKLVPQVWKKFYDIRIPKGANKVQYIRESFAKNFPDFVDLVDSDDEREALMMSKCVVDIIRGQ